MVLDVGILPKPCTHSELRAACSDESGVEECGVAPGAAPGAAPGVAPGAAGAGELSLSVAVSRRSEQPDSSTESDVSGLTEGPDFPQYIRVRAVIVSICITN